MATVYSGWVGGDDWQVRLDYSVVNISDTQCRVDCTAYVVSQYGSMRNSTHCVIYCDGQQSAEVTNASFGAWGTKAIQSWSFTVARPNGTAGRTISVSARIWALYGPSSYASGATASGSATVPARQYLKPNPPSNFKASRVSDAQMSLTWQGNYTGMDGDRPWTGIYVDRRTDDGDWQNIANLSWSALNYTDNSTGANHKYEYRLCAYGPGGNSDHVSAPALYTTPAAPASVAVSRVSGTSVRVSADVSDAPYAESFEVQSNLNSGGWEAVGTVEMFPITDDAGGGTAVYRVRSVIGSLRSAWTESDPVTTIVPPLAPSVTVAGGASVVPTGTDLVVTWVPNHPDGSAQTAAKVALMQGASVVGTYTVEGPATSYDLGAVSTAGSYRVRVQTKGADPDWGAWSGWVSVTVAVPPSVHFSVPPVDGAAVGALPLTVEWEVTDSTGVASQSIALLDASGRTLYSAEPGPKVRELVLGDSTYRLSNATEYALRITVRGGSSLTATAERSFRTSFAEPARPTAQAATDPSDMSVAVSVQAGAESSASGEVIEVPATPGTLVPGLTVYGNTRQNLWVNPSGTANGVTATSNANGSITLSGTSTSDNTWIYTPSPIYSLRRGSTYTLSVMGGEKLPDNADFRVECRNADGSGIQQLAYVNNSSASATFAVHDTAAYFRFIFRTGNTEAALSGTYRVMLNEGSTAEPWCPPGLNSVDELSIVTAGKNLLARMGPSLPHTVAGITFSDNGDGGIRVSGTATAAAYYNFFNDSPAKALRITPGEYTASLIGGVSGLNLSVEYYYGGIGGSRTSWLATNVPGVSNTGSIDQPVYLRPFLSVAKGKTVDTVVYLQLELGSTATAYEPPNITTTPIDLDGHALNSLPDGTRDELRIDGTGAVTLVQRVGVATAPTDAGSWMQEATGTERRRFGLTAQCVSLSNASNGMCDKLPMRLPGESLTAPSYALASGYFGYARNPAITSTAMAATAVGGATYLYPLATPQEVDLPGIAMPSFPADPSTVFCASDVPCAVQVDYPATSSLTVQRVAPDGSRWTVADGLLSGQQAIDPLPPLNMPYAYEVTASTEAGSAYTLDVPHEVETVMAAFNFGAAAAVAELARLDPSWSHSRKRAATLYHFADGGESGGLPVAYGSPDVDGTLSQDFTLLDMDQLRRLQDEARLYPVCWFRDPYGGRYLVYATWDFSGSIPWDKVEVTASMTETVFEEAW